MRRRLTKARTALRRHLVRTVTIAVVLAAVIATGAAEFAARSVIRDRVARAAPALGDDVVVDAAGGWAVWDLAQERIPRLDISSDAARVGRLSGVRVRARLDDVRLGSGATVGSTRAEVTASTQSIATAIRTAVPSVPLSAVTTDPARGTVLAAVGPGGAGQLTLRPVLADGKVTLSVDGLTVFGRSVPAERLGMGDGALGSVSDAPKDYPLGLKATAVRVQPDGLHIDLTGGPSPLPGA
ncbi:LmeA family phospholipid-binding protein [Streptomyces sp. NPDC059874]|uniref:LmeA family phospholipid-binding protein n=1 Tax=Streptomyces sp. NPDC059874 TaxID=3346983 RepID=UPI0036482C11